MADSPTTRNRLRKQEVGAKTNAWGTDWNEDGGSDRLDEALDGVIAFALSGTKTLTSTNYETDEARMRIINVTGGTGGTVTIPALEKWYLVRNGASGDVIISNGSNSVTLSSGEVNCVVTNGTTIYSANAKTYVDAQILAASLSAEIPSQTGNAGKYITTDGTNASWGAISLDTISGVLAGANGGTGISTYTVGDMLYASDVNTLSALADVATGNALISGGVGVAPAWGKIALTTHVTGTLPVANGGTGITAFATGVATFLGTPTSANLKTVVTDETGSGALVFATSPTLVTPALGTPASGVLTSCTGLPLTTGITGTLGTGNGGTGSASATYCSLTANVSGTLPVANGGTGQTTYTNGQLLIGNTTGNTLTKATLTAGTWTTITNGTGSITVASSLPYTESASSLVLGTGAGGAAAGALYNTVIGLNGNGAALNTGLGDGNTLYGYNSGRDISAGSNNTFIGRSSGYQIVNSSGNTLIGYDAGSSITSGSYNTIVGSYTGSAALASNVVLSDGNGTRKFWHDNTDAFVLHSTTASAANAFLDSGTNALKRSTSSMRYKRDAEPMDYKFAEAILALDPIWYRSKCAGDNPGHSFWGFSAEQAAEIDPRLVFWEYAPEDYDEPDENNERWPRKDAVMVPGGFAYDRLTVHLTAIAKRQRAQIRDLKDANAAFEARLAALEAKLG